MQDSLIAIFSFIKATPTARPPTIVVWGPLPITRNAMEQPLTPPSIVREMSATALVEIRGVAAEDMRRVGAERVPPE
jgi:hypothetical protein